MLDDLTKEIKAQLYERVKSPLFGAFAFSWVFWNYRVLLVLVSDLKFPEKMEYIDKTYPTAWDLASLGVLGPLVSAVLFLWLYPYPARWMYRYWAKQQKKLKEVQQSIEDETPLTQEEANALRKAGLAQTKEFQEQLKGLTATNKELEAQLKVLQDDNLRLEAERKQFEESAKHSEEQLASARGAALSPAQQHFQKATLRTRLSAALDRLSDKGKETISDLFPLGSEIERDIYLYLVASGGGATKDKIPQFLEVNPLELQPAILALVDKGIISHAAINTNYAALADDGKQVARETGLTRLLPGL